MKTLFAVRTMRGQITASEERIKDLKMAAG